MWTGTNFILNFSTQSQPVCPSHATESLDGAFKVVFTFELRNASGESGSDAVWSGLLSISDVFPSTGNSLSEGVEHVDKSAASTKK